MAAISVFDIFKVGVGPSSSHTLGPWKAATDFTGTLAELSFDRIKVDLYGSLSKTGRGHCTDLAVQLGLNGYAPEIIDTDLIPMIIQNIADEQLLVVKGLRIVFDPVRDVIFHPHSDPNHPNTLAFTAYLDGLPVHSETYYSLGGGFIQRAGEEDEEIGQDKSLPYPIELAEELFTYTQSQNCHISDIVLANERKLQSLADVKSELSTIYQTMLACVYRGCTTDGILPGGLNVKRRAKKLCNELLGDVPFRDLEEWMDLIEEQKPDFNRVSRWVSCFALAVNEENAALGRVVTSPTNGAAGVIPAVMLYAYFFAGHNTTAEMHRFLLTAGEIGSIFKKGATISAAVGGCQAEIGVSSAMAAAGLTEVMGGTPAQSLMAAEIAMEHHLGLTCDPIGGLVQIPCIERNAMGAIKAITAAQLALSGDPKSALVNLDVVVKTMWDTAQAMNSKYKETSEGGLAINLTVVYPEC
ncbi:L-serine ammonia-lyase [Lewinellaceae bacterium SD302]|nr:L-serine ammonia-lyase [Lewinellaceae bacterium SD302]